MANAVLESQKPSPSWSWKVTQVALKIASNIGLSTTQSNGDNPLLAKLYDLEQRMRASIAHHRKLAEDQGLTGAKPIVGSRENMPVEDHEALLKEVDAFIDSLPGGGGRQLGATPEPPVTNDQAAPKGHPTSLHEYRELFRSIELPAVANDFETDERFAKYRVAGPNPMTLYGVTKAELIALVGDRISDVEFNQILGTCHDSLQRAGDTGRLCVVNYKSLSGTDPVVGKGSSFVTDPIAVFAEPALQGNDVHIKPVAIQLGQDTVHSELLLANADDKYRWQMAKTIVQVADCIHHELVSHLAHTHLVMESFSIAIQRNLKDEHPISRLLRPHIEGTNFINSAAASNLIAPYGPIDSFLCNFSESRLRSLQTLAISARLGFDFTGRMPDNELASRNVGKLKVFPYRDDALDIWQALLDWAEDYVDLYYQDDKAVVDDSELAEWAKDLRINANLIGFEVPQTKNVLTKTLAMIMFTGSAQHAAVNFSQFDQMTFAPAMPGAAWSSIPPVEDGPSDEQQWFDMLPPVDKATVQLNLLYALGGVKHGVLGEYRSNEFPYLGTLESKANAALEDFRDELDGIERRIKRRNRRRRGYFAYEHLLPEYIPASINI